MSEKASPAEVRLLSLFERLGIKTTTIEHPPALTVEDIKKVSLPGPACKNLFLKDSHHKLWLVCALPDTKIGLKELAKTLKAPELRFAQADLLMKHLGVEPGSVTLFALINDDPQSVSVVLDTSIFTQEQVGFHPLRNTATTMIAPKDIRRFIEACGKTPQEIDFSQVA
jgi:Ala-tRNA(Pro) deacylase